MRRCRPLLGTYVEIDADRPEAIEAGFAAIARVHRLMSAHEPDSELSRINRFAHLQSVEVSGETREVVERALSWSRMSSGAFDVVRAGAEALGNGRIPRHADQPAPQTVHWSALTVSGNFVRLSAPAALDLGGIAKGFAVDQAVKAMRSAGAGRGLVNAGGDMFAFGPRPWPSVVVNPATRRPLAEVELRNEALATSALHPDGRGPHLPAATDWISVSVCAPSACDADALTKIVWTGAPNLGGMLETYGAKAFGIRADGVVDDISGRSLAA